MHCKRLTDAPGKFFIGAIAVLGQGPGQLFGEWIAQEGKVVQSVGSAALHRRLLRRKVICGNMEVQEVTRCMELRAELFRWPAHIQRSRRHDALEYGLATTGQFQSRG